MIAATVDKAQIEAIRLALKDKAHRLKREIATAINATAKKVRIEAARALKKELPAKVPIKLVKAMIRSKSIAKESMGSMVAIVRLRNGDPLPLRYFLSEQKKKGVVVKSKEGVRVHMNRNIKGKAGKTFHPKAFIVNRYGANVFERVDKERGPLKQIYGPRPGDFFESAGIVKMAYALARSELPKQMERRISFLMKQTSGGLRGTGSRKGRGNQ